MKKYLVFLVVVSFAIPLVAQEEDAEGCRDSKTLTRLRGCIISECSKKDYDAAEVFVNAALDVKSVEGEVEIIQYRCPESLSGLMIARNVENAMKTQGYVTVFTGPAQNNFPAVTMRKGNSWLSAESNEAPGYKLTIVRAKEMEQQVVASAESMEADITKSGYCSIYGIQFDSGKAAILPDSEQCLGEMAKLLKKNPWKLQIEGHTDNVGGKDANAKLSQARAEAVRGWLVSHGIEASRLTAKGFGDSKPVGDNATEEGRAKNRRVDLRKM